MQTMRGPRQTTITLAMAALTLALLVQIDMSLQVLCVAAAALALLALRLSIPAPRALARLAASLGTATLYVYLLHPVVIHGLRPLGLSDPANIAMAVLLSFAVGVVAHRAFVAADGLLREQLGRLRA